MPQHVLLADDSTNVHRLVRETLEPEGLQVTCVDNGEDALRLAVASPPDLILADITMPRLGGLDLAARLRLEPRCKALPVVFLVGPFDEFDEERSRAVDAFAQLPKPINPLRLAAVVQEALNRTQGVTMSIEDEDEATLLEQVSELPEPLGLVRESLEGLGEISEIQELSELSDFSSEFSEDAWNQAIRGPESGSSALGGAAPGSAASGSTASGSATAGTSGPRDSFDAPMEGQGLDNAPALSDSSTGSPSPLSRAGEDADSSVLAAAVQAQVQAQVHEALMSLLRPDLVVQLVRDTVREEVRRLLPDLLKQAVKVRIAELEQEVHALEADES